MHCCVCGAEVESYSEQGDAYCQIHWVEHLQGAATPTGVALGSAPLTSVQEIKALDVQWSATPPTRLVLDLETTGLDPRKNKVVTLAVGTPEQVTIIDLRSYYRADPAHQQAWREALQHLLHRDTVLWIGHNLKFDWSFLAQQFGVQLGHVYDTMLVEKLLNAGSHSAASLLASAARYGITVTKEQRSWFIDLDTRHSEWVSTLPDAQLAYIRQDIDVPYQLYERQQEMIARQDLARVVSLEHETLPAMAAMEIHGVCVDVERWRNILAVRTKQKAEVEATIQQVLGNALAGTQPEQGMLFGERVFPRFVSPHPHNSPRRSEHLGCIVTSTSKEALQDVQYQHPVIAQLLEWKALEKFESAFG